MDQSEARFHVMSSWRLITLKRVYADRQKLDWRVVKGERKKNWGCGVSFESGDVSSASLCGI